MAFEYHSVCPRRGLATAEVVGIFLTLAVGMGLGLTVFAPAPSPERMPQDAPQVEPISQAPADNASAAQLATPTTGDRDAQLAEQVQQLQAQLSKLTDQMSQQNVQRSGSPVPTNGTREARTASSRGTGPDREMGQRTLTYWNRLNDIMLKEEQMRKVPSGGLTADNVSSFLKGRGTAGEFAAQAIRKLPASGVEPEVVSLASDIASWYDHGNQLNGMANHLYHEADDASRKGSPGQQWQNAEKAHHQSVSDINRRGDELRERLSEKYGIPFPDLR